LLPRRPPGSFRNLLGLSDALLGHLTKCLRHFHLREVEFRHFVVRHAGSLVRSARTGLSLSPRRNTHTPHWDRIRCALALARRSTRSARSRRRPRVVTRRKQGPIQFLENNPKQSSFWVRYVPQDKEKLGSPSNCKVPSRVQLPPAAALRRSHTDGRRPPPFPRDSCVRPL
jgi:hypothetical protein